MSAWTTEAGAESDRESNEEAGAGVEGDAVALAVDALELVSRS